MFSSDFIDSQLTYIHSEPYTFSRGISKLYIHFQQIISRSITSNTYSVGVARHIQVLAYIRIFTVVLFILINLWESIKAKIYPSENISLRAFLNNVVAILYKKQLLFIYSLKIRSRPNRATFTD